MQDIGKRLLTMIIGGALMASSSFVSFLWVNQVRRVGLELIDLLIFGILALIGLGGLAMIVNAITPRGEEVGEKEELNE